MDKQLDIEALDTLIKAVGEYMDALTLNRQILLNAATVCDTAMGSDAIAQKHIGRLNETLKELEKASQIAANVAKELRTDRKQALDVLNI